MNLTIVNLFNKTICRAAEGLNVQILWFYDSEEPVISESYSNHKGQVILSHFHIGKAKVLVDGEEHGIFNTPGIHTIILED